MCDFKPGDEVVCVDSGGSDEISNGAVYTVLEVVDAEDGLGPRVMLAEVDNGDKYGPSDWWGWRPFRFRKVIRKTESQSLTEWLNQPAGNTDRFDKSKKRTSA